jgi:ornithine cyclodeaminase/alanine dehydrogenase-like protein (mu-crystallin family)
MTEEVGRVTVAGLQQVLVLNRTEVRQAMKWSPLLEVARDALIGLASEDALPSISAQLPVPGATLHLKAGAVSTPQILSVKANLRPDVGSVAGAILAFDHGNQCLRAILASTDLTAMRTAAIAAVAAVELVSKKNPRIAIIGAGSVSAYTLEVLTHLSFSDDVRIWSRSPEHAHTFVKNGARPQNPIACRTVEEAVADADLVITCTPSRVPLVKVEYLGEDTVVLAMGADSPGKRELGAGILESATLYADVLVDALRVGELAHIAKQDGQRATSIGTRLAKPQISNPLKGRIVFDSVGSSAVDAAVVAMTLEAALESGSGQWIALDE